MIIRKTFQIAIAMLFSLGLFSTGAVANSVCGKACCMATVKYDHGQVAVANAASMPNGCCSETKDIPCDLERGILYSMPKANILNARVKDHHPCMVIIATNDLSGNYTFNNFIQQLFTKAPVRSAPIYLQNLSLIC